MRTAITLCVLILSVNAVMFANDKNVGDTIALGEITVQAMLPAVKYTAMGFMVSVDKVKHLQNKTLDRILNVSPGVKLDNDGNIRINGNGGVTVVVDDKTLRLSGDQLLAYLKSYQGSDIRNIEVMSNPTAAYDSEGTGGIIRINTNRRRKMGVTGFVSSRYDFDCRSSYGETAGLTYAVGNVAIYGNYTFSSRRSVGERHTENYYANGNSNITDELFSTKRNNTHSYRAGFDWNFGKRHYLGMEYNGMDNRRTDSDYSVASLLYGGNLTEVIRTPSESLYKPDNNMLTFNYVWRIDTVGQVLKLISDYSHIKSRDSYSDYSNGYYDHDGEFAGRLFKRQISKEQAEVYSAKVDYEKPFSSKRWKLSAGLKFSRVVNRYSYNMLNWRGEGDVPHDDPLFRDRFKYTEDLYAAYATVSYTVSNLDSNAGLRLELEHDRTDGVSFVKGERSRHDGTQLFPSVFVYWKPNAVHGFMFYYGMRIYRPDYQLVNPFVLYISDVSIKKGNPGLKSPIFNKVELTYVVKEKYFMSLRAQYEHKIIRDFSYSDGKNMVTTFGNIDGAKMYYFSGYAPFGYRKWTSSLQLNAGAINTGYGDLKRWSFMLNFSLTNYVNVTENLGMELNFDYAVPQKDIYLSSNRHVVKLDFNLDYTFGEKGGWMMSCGVDDILNSTRKRSLRFTYPDLLQNVDATYFPGRTYRVGLKYNFHFGARKANSRTKEKSNEEETNRIY